MKKTILILYPDRFTHFINFRYELSQLEKKYNFKIVINDLSILLNNKKLNSVWKTKRYKKALIFQSLTQWINFFNKIKKKNIIIINFATHYGCFNNFIIKLLISLSKKPVFLYEESNPDIKVKKNISWLLSSIYHHNFNYKVYFYYIKNYFFHFLMGFFSYEKTYTLLSDYNENFNFKKNSVINVNQPDYSNSLLYNNHKKSKKKYIIYLDNGGPYFRGDTDLIGNKLPNYDIKGWYNDLLNFFNKLEHYFNAKIIIIPHPKYRTLNKKIKTFNPYYKNKIVNNESTSLSKLSANALFFMSRGSTAVAHAVAHNKPVISVFSSNLAYEKFEIKQFIYQTKLLGTKPFDIIKSDLNEINKFLKINKSKYYEYKYKYLTTKKEKVEKKPNYKIIGNFISNHI